LICTLHNCYYCYIAEGALQKVVGRRLTDRYVFLFDGLIILTKQNKSRISVTGPVGDYKLKEKYHVRLLDITDRDDTDGEWWYLCGFCFALIESFCRWLCLCVPFRVSLTEHHHCWGTAYSHSNVFSTLFCVKYFSPEPRNPNELILCHMDLCVLWRWYDLVRDVSDIIDMPLQDCQSCLINDTVQHLIPLVGPSWYLTNVVCLVLGTGLLIISAIRPNIN